MQLAAAVTNYSTEVADALTAQNMPDWATRAALAELAQRYSGALNTDAETLAAMSVALAREEGGDGVMREIVELRANADAIARAGLIAEARHRRVGVEDLRACRRRTRSRRCSRWPRKRVLAGLGFARTVVFVRTGQRHFQGAPRTRTEVDAVLPTLTFNSRVRARRVSSRDREFGGHLHRECARSADRRAFAAMVQALFRRCPRVRAVAGESEASTVALLYGDWTLAQHVRKITQPEMSAFNELTRELSRFFANADWKEVELI